MALHGVWEIWSHVVCDAAAARCGLLFVLHSISLVSVELSRWKMEDDMAMTSTETAVRGVSTRLHGVPSSETEDA